MDPVVAALTQEIAAYGIKCATGGIGLTTAGLRRMDVYLVALVIGWPTTTSTPDHHQRVRRVHPVDLWSN